MGVFMTKKAVLRFSSYKNWTQGGVEQVLQEKIKNLWAELNKMNYLHANICTVTASGILVLGHIPKHLDEFWFELIMEKIMNTSVKN